MKKLLVLLTLLFMSVPANATYWYEFSEKTYIDLDSLQKTGDTAFAWVKTMNDGNIKPINNKKISYSLSTLYIDLISKKMALKDAYFYDSNNNQVDESSREKLYWDVIIPGSIGDSLYEVVKKYPRFDKVTDEELWVDIDELTKLDVFSLLMTNSKCCNMWIMAYHKKPKKPNAKVRYVKALLSVNLVDQKYAIIETVEYNKKGEVVKVKKYDDLSYRDDYDNSLKSIIGYINRLNNELEKPNNFGFVEDNNFRTNEKK